MKIRTSYISLFVLYTFASTFAFAQQKKLTEEDAIAITLKNNYSILVSENNEAISKNNTSIYNSGYLPTLSISGGSNHSINTIHSETQEGLKTEVIGASSSTYNAIVNLNYTVFNGLNRKYNLKKLQNTNALSQLQTRETIENALLQIFASYYDVARLTENSEIQKQTLDISKTRLTRAQYSFEFGQGTKLDILNAEVDINNDSIAYLDGLRQLNNAKRDLNVLMGTNLNNIDFKVVTEIHYNLDMDKESLLKQALENNVLILQMEAQIKNSAYDLKINQSGWLPNISINSAYNWNNSLNDETYALKNQNTNGISGGLNVTWNLFDGGRTKVNIQNVKINQNTQEVLKSQTIQNISRNVQNAWETYQNALFTLNVQKSNVKTNKRNFERTNEQYKLGQITSVNFRQAQLNLLNANLSLNQAKYNAKNAEYKLKQLAGILL